MISRTRNRDWLFGVAMTLALGLGGCGGLPVGAPQWTPSGAVEQVLRYHEYAAQLGRSERAEEIARTRDELARRQDDLDRLRLAVLLGPPPAGNGNYAEAQAVLEPLLGTATTQPSPVVALAHLLNAAIGEQRRLDGLLNAANQRLREERRRTEANEQAASGNLRSLTQKLKEEQNRADALEKKLQELRSIEKSLSGRPRTAPPAP